jgi:hypothetical protein
MSLRGTMIPLTTASAIAGQPLSEVRVARPRRPPRRLRRALDPDLDPDLDLDPNPDPDPGTSTSRGPRARLRLALQPQYWGALRNAFLRPLFMFAVPAGRGRQT